MFPQPRYRFLDNVHDDTGMVTPEYAVGIFASMALAGLLLWAVTSEPVREAIGALIEEALHSRV
jgi:hypothetical protein